jgi:hypothetical protein
VDHVVEPLRRDRAALDRLLEPREVAQVRGADVRALLEGLVARAGVEVGRNPAPEAPVVLQDVDEQVPVRAGVLAVHALECAHDGARVCVPHDDLPLASVQLPKGALADYLVDEVTGRLLVVADVVLRQRIRRAGAGRP